MKDNLGELLMLDVNKGEERKEAIIMKGSTQSEPKWPANILPSPVLPSDGSNCVGRPVV